MSNVAEDNIIALRFQPDRNCRMLQYSVLRIRVAVRQRQAGASDPLRVIIRTNLNQAQRIRRQIIDLAEKRQSYSTDYYDIPATYDPATDQYGVDVLLSDVGYFEFKVRVESGRYEPPLVTWADGPNVGISVTPLAYGRDNPIYCAFIRQFVPDKHRASLSDRQLEAAIQDLEEKGAYVLPPSGNFENFQNALPFIIEQLGMKIIHLLPINPVPVSYGRMGMYGSPYANTDYFGIDQTYATFSRYKTIEEQFVDLTSTIHGLGAKVFLDMVINHTGWASSIHFTHRNWRKIGQDRRIVSPGAWGVVWGDLVELDYRHRDLWEYMSNVFLAWCRRGIDGFRLDAGYMVPLEVWRYIIAKVRQEFPETLFLLEGLGGPWATTERMLTEGQMNWAYSELFQNYDQKQIVDYLKYAQGVSAERGVMVHYAETHDNDRLARKGQQYARMRVCLSALTSFSGAWGLTNGVEWFATERIDVHRNCGLNWGNPENMVADIAQLNRILAENPAFWHGHNIEFLESGQQDVLAFSRRSADGSNVVLCLINLNVEQSRQHKLDLAGEPLGRLRDQDTVLENLFTAERLEWPADDQLATNLAPGGWVVHRLAQRNVPYRPTIPTVLETDPAKVSLIYQILLNRFGHHEVGRIDQDRLLHCVNDFRKFIALVHTASLDELVEGPIDQLLERIPGDQVDRYSAVWTFRDSNREFIISGDKWLVVHAFVPSTTTLKTASASLSMESIPCIDSLGYMAFFAPLPNNEPARLGFNWKIPRGRMLLRHWQDQHYRILSLPSSTKPPKPRRIYPLNVAKERLRDDYPTVLLTNRTGLVCQCPAMPGTINSKYDALFSIAGDSSVPADRWALVKTIDETIEVGSKVFDLDESFLVSFSRFPHPRWEFVFDDGEYYVKIERLILCRPGRAAVFVRYKLLDANAPVNVIAKCYLEHRSIHHQLHLADDDQLRIMRHWKHALPNLPASLVPKFLIQPIRPTAGWRFPSPVPKHTGSGISSTTTPLSGPCVFPIYLRATKEYLNITTWTT